MKIKKKLRDISLEELMAWDEKNCGSLDCENCVLSNASSCDYTLNSCWINHKDMYSDKFLNQEIEIEAKDVLDEIEKKYLKSIIRPFKDRVVSIEKRKNINSEGTFYYIGIIVKHIAIDRFSEAIYLPYFKPESKMYEGMELNKEYTLKELGL